MCYWRLYSEVRRYQRQRKTNKGGKVKTKVTFLVEKVEK